MTYTGPSIETLSDLTHASRDGKNTLCGRPAYFVSEKWNPKMTLTSFEGKFLSVPSCRTCREAIEDSEYQLTGKA